jgi:hypothetical protein
LARDALVVHEHWVLFGYLEATLEISGYGQYDGDTTPGYESAVVVSIVGWWGAEICFLLPDLSPGLINVAFL